MNHTTSPALDEVRQQLESIQEIAVETEQGVEELEVAFYPLDQGDAPSSDVDEQVAALVDAARTNQKNAITPNASAVGYVSNARNATAQSNAFQFWAPAEDISLGVGSLVRHSAPEPNNPGTTIITYGVVAKTDGHTLGLDDFATHVYEQDGAPPLDSIQPSQSRRRPIVNCETKVLTSSQKMQRPILSGPVYVIRADELAAVHGKTVDAWPGLDYMLLGFYQDSAGEFGILAEERERVLGPKQGHAVLSGLPGAGKTSLYQTTTISLFAQLHNDSPGVATLAFNAKGADLLFLDHLDTSELSDDDRKMWKAAGVDINERPFGRCIFYVPLADDGLNRNTLRVNSEADIPGYSETREFSLGIQALWPYLGFFFDKQSSAASNLLAEVEQFFEDEHGDEGFTLGDVLRLFREKIKRPQKERSGDRWEGFNHSVIQAVYQRLSALPAILGGLIDINGKGFGLDVTDLKPRDIVVIDFERIMANPRNSEVDENVIKIITAYVLNRVTEAMTRGTVPVDHVIVFADELNRLAPRHGDSGIGAYLAQIARTTRDRGVVLFGAGQFRSGINEDILKSASVHYSMQTPEDELNDRIYNTLSEEFKTRLTQLKPGEALVKYPSLRTSIFVRFPRPFVLAGGVKWKTLFPPVAAHTTANCVASRLRRLDPERPPQTYEIKQLIEGLPERNAGGGDKQRETIVAILREVEMWYGSLPPMARSAAETPWARFTRLIKEQLVVRDTSAAGSRYTPMPIDPEDEEE